MRLRLGELVLLFAVIPLSLLVLRASGIRVLPLPMLWLACGLCLYLLWRGRGGLASSGVRTEVDRPDRQAIVLELVTTVLICVILLLALYPLISTEPMFRFPRERPLIWVIVLVLYPLLSVVPQGIVFRRWFVARVVDFMKPLDPVLR